MLFRSGNLGFPRLGVAGAALATAIGFTVALILTLISILGHNKNNGFLRLSFKEDWRPHSDTMRAITKVGGNAMIEQVAMRFGFFAYARIVADLGTDAFAAHQVCMQFLNITFTVGDGIGIAGTALVGQMLGEKRPDLSMMYGKVSQRMALAASLTLLSFLIIFRTPLVSLFINGAKEASGNFSLLAEAMALCGDEMNFWSGNDDQIVPLMSMGGKGVISVLSNVAPRAAHDICQFCLDGKFAEAAKMQKEYLDLINALFCEVNPIPVKEAMNLMGLDVGECRLPLYGMDDAAKSKLASVLRKYRLMK